MHGLIHRHLHHSKRALLNQNTHPAFWVKLLERATIVAGVIGPAMTLPQIFKIYVPHDATGVSALSWFAFALLDIPFILYGLVHKDRPIIITYVLWLAVNLAVAVGAVVYG